MARALAADPPVLLMDEPFGAVDPVVRTQLQDELLRLQQELRKTIVFVTHDIDEAVRLGDRIAVFRTGGHLVQCAAARRAAGPPRRRLRRRLPGRRARPEAAVADRPSRTSRRARRPGRAARCGPLAPGRPRRGKPLGWRDTDGAPAGRPTSSPYARCGTRTRCSSALNESVASPAGLVARVDADGVLTGVTSRDDIHEDAAHAGRPGATTRGHRGRRTPRVRGGRMTIDWSWIPDHTDDLTTLTLSHLQPPSPPSCSGC